MEHFEYNEHNYAETYKFNAYREVAVDATHAKEIINNKGLVFGEAAIVPFAYPNKDDENWETRIMLGVGSLNGDVEIFSNIVDSSTNVSDAVVDFDGSSDILSNALQTLKGVANDVSDSSVYIPSISTTMTLSQAFDYILTLK